MPFNSIYYGHSISLQFADLATGFGCLKHHSVTNIMLTEGCFFLGGGNVTLWDPLRPSVFHRVEMTNPGPICVETSVVNREDKLNVNGAKIYV